MIPKSFQQTDKPSRARMLLRLIFLIILALSALLYYESRKIKYSRFYTLNNSVSGNFLASRFALKNNDLTEALEYTEASLKQAPDDINLLSRALHLASAIGKFEKAKQFADKINRLDPTIPYSNIFLALYEIYKKDFARAQLYLSKIRYDNKPIADINLVLGKLLIAWVNVQKNDFPNAILMLEKLEDGPFRPFVHYQLAIISDYTGDTQRAEKEYLTALKNPFKSYRLIELSVNFFDRIGKKEMADQIYNNYMNEYILLSQNTQMPRVNTRIISNVREGIAELLAEVGAFLENNNFNKDAIEYLQLALYLRPDLPHAQYILANILSEGEQPGQANDIYDKINPSSPFSWKGRINKAKNLYKMGNINRAKNDLLAMSEERPKNYDSLLTVGELLMHESKFGEAAKVYSDIIKRIENPNKSHWFIFYSRGVCYERSSQWDKAEPDFVKALELYPNHPEVLNYLAYSWLLRNENLEKAKEMLEEGLKQEPEEAHIIDSYGFALFKLGDYAGALDFLEKAITISPNDPTINDHLGDIYWRMGRTNEAVFQWKKALTFNPETEDVVKIKRKIAEGLPENKNEKKKK